MSLFVIFSFYYYLFLIIISYINSFSGEEKVSGARKLVQDVEEVSKKK